MTTEKQLAANRENAKLSTGPRSEEGKAASSTNALRHGLASRGLIILPGQQPAFDELEAGLRGSLLPAGPLQEFLFRRALTAAWNLHRCEQAEVDSYRIIARPGLDPMVSNDHETITRVRRYAREAENSMYKAMRELGKLQEEAQFRNEANRQPGPEITQTQEAISEVCSLNQVMKNVTRQRRSETIVQTADRKRPTSAPATAARIEPIPVDQTVPTLSRAAAL